MINKFMLLFLFGVLIASFSQVLLKMSAGIKYPSKYREYLNGLVILAYFLFFCSMMIAVVSYRSVPLKTGAIIESTGYVFVALLSRLFFKEKLDKIRTAGIFLIVAGFIIFNL